MAMLARTSASGQKVTIDGRSLTGQKQTFGCESKTCQQQSTGGYSP